MPLYDNILKNKKQGIKLVYYSCLLIYNNGAIKRSKSCQNDFIKLGVASFLVTR